MCYCTNHLIQQHKGGLNLEWRFNSDMPIYTQLVAQIEFGIVSGQLEPGARISAVRDMAAEAGVNPNTMQRAMQELERAGLVYSQRGNGRFVTEDVGIIDSAKKGLAERHIREFLGSMRSLGYDREEIIAMLCAEKEDNNGGGI